MIKDQTYAQVQNRLIFAKEVPVNETQNPRSMDTLFRKSLRFELELTQDAKLMHIAVFEPQDLDTLFIVTLDWESFDMIRQQQNLCLKSFGLFPAHLCQLLNQCLTDQLLIAMRELDARHGTVNLSIYEPTKATYLRHLSLNLVRATPTQAKAWLAKRYQI